MLNNSEIIQTIEMIKDQHLDIRTITMHVSLFDCISDDKQKVADNVYNKLKSKAGNLTKVADEIQGKYGIPIINKRISVTPISLIGGASGGYVEIAKALDKFAKEANIDFVGGYTALLQKGITPFEREFLETIPTVLATTDRVCSSVNTRSSRTYIN